MEISRTSFNVRTIIAEDRNFIIEQNKLTIENFLSNQSNFYSNQRMQYVPVLITQCKELYVLQVCDQKIQSEFREHAFNKPFRPMLRNKNRRGRLERGLKYSFAGTRVHLTKEGVKINTRTYVKCKWLLCMLANHVRTYIRISRIDIHSSHTGTVEVECTCTSK